MSEYWPKFHLCPICCDLIDNGKSCLCEIARNKLMRDLVDSVKLTPPTKGE